MSRNSRIFNRRSIRLKEYDYSSAGGYFVTICTNNRAMLFGTVANDEVILNKAGLMIAKWIAKLPEKFPGCIVDCVIIMPNHVHIILILTRDGTTDSDTEPNNFIDLSNSDHAKDFPPLGRIIQWFKTMTTNEYIRHVKQDGWKPFRKRLWQRNYFEHIIRDEIDLKQKRKYVVYNPCKWPQDQYYKD